MTVDELRHWWPAGRKRPKFSLYSPSLCDVCLAESPPYDLNEPPSPWNVVRRSPARGPTLNLCDECWTKWCRQNQDVLVMVEMLK